MDNNIKKYLHDILESTLSIEDFLGEKCDFTVYESNKMLRRAIVIVMNADLDYDLYYPKNAGASTEHTVRDFPIYCGTL
jgi:hypothetical protein